VLRLVLDTNVWLDWLVFDDPGVAPLKSAVQTGGAAVFINRACEQELERVLAYPRPRRTLEAAAQSACVAECRCIACNADDVPPALDLLPRCRDADDQKFLELARDCGADALVTKDRALLELARHKVRCPKFRIVTPQQLTHLLLTRETATHTA
jgi:putative PIN family toxin of toxin-antitoxin system